MRETMIHRAFRFLLAVAFSLASLLCRQAEAQPQPGDGGQPDVGNMKIPVRISEGAEVGAKGDIKTALRRSTDTWDVLVGKPGKKMQLRNCADYLKIAGQEIETQDPIDQRGLLGMEARCQALRMLREALPSERSFLGGFKMDAGAPDLLPAALYLDLSAGEARKLRAATREGRSWKSFDPKVRGKINDRGELAFTGDGYDTQLVEYARADFNHDGVEDILILRTGFPIGGTMTDYTVFLLSRTSETVPLQVLKTWRRAY